MTVVTVFLRGGADGLNLVVPHGDPDYLALRPTIGIADSLDLDGFFGLHPALAPVMPIWEAGELAVIHAAGSDDTTRSHFEAQPHMERGGDTTGWLGRMVAVPGGLAAVAIGAAVPESLRGFPAAALRTVAEHTIDDADFRQALAALYRAGDSDLERAGRETLEQLGRLEQIASPDPGDGFPEQWPDLREVAGLINANCGLQVAAVDLGGWDTHILQGPLLEERAATLAAGLAAFRAAVGPDVVVVMTEFGRRAYENGALGTDHGRAGVMLVMGGAVRGGVHTDWPGLKRSDDMDAHDLRVTTDYRDVLAEVALAAGRPHLSRIFPGFRPRLRGVMR